MEGKVSIEPHGKPISEEALKTNKGVDYLLHEGDSTTQYSWKDLMGLALDWDSEVRRPFSSNISPDEPPLEDNRTAADNKGKRVIGQDSNLEGKETQSREVTPPAQPQNPSKNNLVPYYHHMVEVIVEGKSIFIPRANWDSFYSHLTIGPQADPSRGSGLMDPSPSLRSPNSSPDDSEKISTDAISSSAQPSGFERPRRLRRRRRAPLSLTHKPYCRFLAGSGRTSLSQAKKGQSTSSSTPLLSINALSVDSISSIAANCGLVDPIPIEAIRDIRSLEMDRAKVIS